MRTLGALLLAGWALCGAARAEDGDILTGTLATIHQRGTILVGYREEALPFSFRNQAGQPVGFSLDLCHGIASDVAQLLNLDLVEADAPAWQTGLRIRYVPVAADARLPMLVSGAIDLECGSTTATAERAKTVAFSPVFFLAGTKLMVPLQTDGSPTATSFRDLAGKRVAVGAGTTNGVVMDRLAATVTPPVTVVRTPSLDAAYGLLAGGTVDAFASDDILLSGFIASKADGKRFGVVGDFLSFEPYAIGFRRDDPAFAAQVRSSFERMGADGTLVTRYRRWFTDRLPTGQTLALPMSAQLAEMYRALGQPD